MHASSRVLITAVLAVSCGCPARPPADHGPAPSQEPVTLRLLVIGDPQLAKVVKREWDARSEGELKLRELSVDEFSKLELRRLAADAVIYPAAMLGELAAPGWLAPLPKDALYETNFQQRDIYSVTRGLESAWGNEPIAVPLGGPPLLLFYRRDIFDKLAIAPPDTWQDYQGIVQRLANRQEVREYLASDNSTWFPTVEPLGDSWSAQLLLARSACYAKHRSQYSTLFDYRTMQPLIASPPFLRAMGELQETVQASVAMPTDCGPAAAVQHLLDGHCAMAIGWLESGHRDAKAADTAVKPEIGILPLPGSAEVFNFRSDAWERRGVDESTKVPLVGFSGRLGSLTDDCLQPAAAVQLLLWLSGPEMGAQISSAGTTTGPYRDSHLAQIDRWIGSQNAPELGRQYAAAIQRSLNEPNVLIALRIPGQEKYLAVLADSVRNVIAGESPGEASLSAAAAGWKKLTESLGYDSQRAAYMQSIGMER